jgi:hypothetical protein
MGTVCQHEIAPLEIKETLSGYLSDLPTLLTEEGIARKPPANPEMAKGLMQHHDNSPASEGNPSLRQEGGKALEPGMSNDNEGHGTEGGKDEPPQPEWPLLSKTCHEPLPLVVVVLGAKGLREADWLPGTHRYLHTVLRTCPGRHGKPTCQTRAVRDVVDPMNDVVDANWAGEDGTMEAQYVAGDSLEFDVVDTDGNGNSGLLGRAFLEAAKFSEHGFTGDLPLEGAGAIFGTAATLSVEIMQPGHTTRQVNQMEAADAKDPSDPRDPRDPRAGLFALIKSPQNRRRHLRAEAFARQRMW